MSQAEPSRPSDDRQRRVCADTRRSTSRSAMFAVVPALAVAIGVVSCTVTGPAERLATVSQAETPDTFGIGSGRDGDVTVAAASTVVNSYAPITAVNAAATQITIGAVHGAAAGFAPDDLVLVWHTTGLAAATSGDQAAITLAGDVGAYEFARVKSVNGALVTVTNPLSSATRFAASSQLVRIPEYKTLTVGAAGSVTPYPWDGTSGGIVVVFATVAVANAGAIQADGAGFRGGGIENAAVQLGCASLDNWSNAMPVINCGGAHKGEGLLSTAYAVANLAAPGAAPAVTYGRGNAANGGGGGEAHNAGGGGGGHAGVGGTGGRTWIGDVNGGGPRFVGGLGGAPLAYTLTDRLVFGGGGGSGEENDMVGTSGGAGGGVVMLRAATLTGAGTVSAAGGSVTTLAGKDGSGGGGAGGAILIEALGAAACASANANGGAGGTGGTDPDGPGGGGAGGYVVVRAASGTCPVAATGGASGTTTTPNALYMGTAYGSTAGAPGSATASTGTGFTGAVCVPTVLGANQCGGCVLDTDCPAAQPVCDAIKNTCGMCAPSMLTACTRATPTCDTTPLHDVCAACNGDFGSTTATHPCPTVANSFCLTSGANAGQCVACLTSATCGNPTPVCSTTNVCVACGGDNGTPAPNACPTTANPYCKSTGACGLCVTDADCATGHAGTLCNMTTGACGNACTVDSQCAVGSWCNNLTGSGMCQPKTINGQPVPGGTCVAAVASRACVSAVCDPDNACGYASGDGPCTTATGALVCRSGVCDSASSKCGLGDAGVPDASDGGDASPADAGDAAVLDASGTRDASDAGDASGTGDAGDAGDAGGGQVTGNDGGDDGSSAEDVAMGGDSSSPDASGGPPLTVTSPEGTIAGGGLSCSVSVNAGHQGSAACGWLIGWGLIGGIRRGARGRRK